MNIRVWGISWRFPSASSFGICAWSWILASQYWRIGNSFYSLFQCQFPISTIYKVFVCFRCLRPSPDRSIRSQALEKFTTALHCWCLETIRSKHYKGCCKVQPGDVHWSRNLEFTFLLRIFPSHWWCDGRRFREDLFSALEGCFHGSWRWWTDRREPLKAHSLVWPDGPHRANGQIFILCTNKSPSPNWKLWTHQTANRIFCLCWFERYSQPGSAAFFLR